MPPSGITSAVDASKSAGLVHVFLKLASRVRYFGRVDRRHDARSSQSYVPMICAELAYRRVHKNAVALEHLYNIDSTHLKTERPFAAILIGIIEELQVLQDLTLGCVDSSPGSMNAYGLVNWKLETFLPWTSLGLPRCETLL